MKKFIATTAIAAGALAASGTASAQDIGNIVLEILGMGSNGYSQGYQGYPSQAVVGQMYRDQSGRTFYYDQYGRQVYTNNGPQIIGYDAWNRPVYSQGQVTQGVYGYGNQYGQYNHNQYGQYNQYGSQWDYDGDGVSNRRDRYPNDRRYR